MIIGKSIIDQIRDANEQLASLSTICKKLTQDEESSYLIDGRKFHHLPSCLD